MAHRKLSILVIHMAKCEYQDVVLSNNINVHAPQHLHTTKRTSQHGALTASTENAEVAHHIEGFLGEVHGC
jgi:hypothetical protein